MTSSPARLRARAPGKLVVLGEYAVLEGAPALVLAVDRRCRVRLESREAAAHCLETRCPYASRSEIAPGQESHVKLVDLVIAALGDARLEQWNAVLDSREFFVGERKLGLGSSAAALCAWAGAWAAWIGASPPSLTLLIELHRRFQGGAGSGLDVAASLTGGAIVFRTEARSLHHVGSVRLPKGVGFAGIFAGRSASTPDLLARYRAWRRDRPAEAADRQRAMQRIAEAGCTAVRSDDGEAFLHAVDSYGRELEALGEAIGADIVTAEHRAVARLARRHGVTYKISGAGGGDLGVALASDDDALEAFKRSVAEQGYEVVELSMDRQGLMVEEQTE